MDNNLDKYINQIICGECVQVMRKFPDNCIDLTVTSPPYDNLRDYNEYVFNWEETINELYRITKIGGVVVWVVGDATIKGSETGTSFRQALFFKEVGFNLHDTMIYKKKGTPYPSKVRYNSVFEYMFVFSKQKPKTINLIKDRKNRWGGVYSFGNQSYRQKDGILKSKQKRKVNKYGIRDNIWEYSSGYGNSHSNNNAHEHPATFPEKLAEDHIISWSNEGDIVFDPMCGSGTTCRMAQKNNRKFIGIDISEEYCQLAKSLLLEQTTEQTT